MFENQAEKMDKKEKIKAYAALGAVCIFWGTTYFAIRIAVKNLPPFFLSGTRHIISGVILCGYMMIVKGHKIPRFKELIRIFVVGFLFIFMSNAMLSWAEVYIPSGLAALLCTFVPLYILLFNLILKKSEPINFYTGCGLLTGLLGMVFIFYDSLGDVSNADYLPGILFTVVANISWAIGTLYLKGAKLTAHPIFSSGLQMVMAGVFITLLSAACGDFKHLSFTGESVAAVIYLVFFGSIIGYSSYTYAVSKLPTTVVSVYAYVNPIVAVLLGCLFLDEKITLVTIFAMILTIVGVFLINRGYRVNLKKEIQTEGG